MASNEKDKKLIHGPDQPQGDSMTEEQDRSTPVPGAGRPDRDYDEVTDENKPDRDAVKEGYNDPTDDIRQGNPMKQNTLNQVTKKKNEIRN